MPIERELNVRFSQKPPTEAEGSSAARACRTRASASVVRSVASATTGTSPEASRTASANDNRTVAGAGVCAASGANAATSHSSRAMSQGLLLRDTMEIKVDVSVEVLLDVERLRHAGPERVPRDNRVHQWRHGELGGNHDVHWTELPVLDAPLDHACHQAVPAGHDFLVVKTSQFRKSCRLGHHKLRDAGHRRLPHQPPVFPYQLLDQLAGAAGEGLRERFTPGDHGHDRLAHNGLEQGFLAVEVEVQGAFGDAGPARHVGELGGGEAALPEYVERGGDDFPRAGVLAALPARLGLVLRWGNGVAHGSWLRSTILVTERSVTNVGSSGRSRPYDKSPHDSICYVAVGV